MNAYDLPDINQFDAWLTLTQAQRDSLAEYGRTPITTDIGERQLDIDRAIRSSDEIGRLKAVGDAFLTHHTAQAWLAVCKDSEYADCPMKVKEMVVRDRVLGTQFVVDGITITERTIKSRIFAEMNANRRLS